MNCGRAVMALMTLTAISTSETTSGHSFFAPSTHPYISHVAKYHQVPLLTDATSTETPAWRCIRQHESTNGKLSSNLYQFQNTALMKTIGMTKPAGDYTRSQQNGFALLAYANAKIMFGDGWHPWLADYAACGL